MITEDIRMPQVWKGRLMPFDHVLEDIASKYHLLPLLILDRSDPPPAHFLCNFQNLISLQQFKLIFGKWLILIAITKVFKLYELLF
jgi:hypothetical protein